MYTEKFFNFRKNSRKILEIFWKNKIEEYESVQQDTVKIILQNMVHKQHCKIQRLCKT